MEPCPLDILGAETEGMIGYLLRQELGNRLPDVVDLDAPLAHPGDELVVLPLGAFHPQHVVE